MSSEKLVDIVSIVISIIASIGIGYFTEKQKPILSGLSSTLNIVPILLGSPAGLLMPLEVVQTLVFHILQNGRENNKITLSGITNREVGFWEKNILFDLPANIVIVVILASGIVAAKYSPRNMRLRMFWKRVDMTLCSLKASGLQWKDVGTERPTCGIELTNSNLSEAIKNKPSTPHKNFDKNEWNSFGVKTLTVNHFIMVNNRYFQPLLPQFKSHRLPEFNGDDVVTIRNMNQLEFLENYDIIEVDGVAYERMNPYDASIHRWRTRWYIPVSSWILSFFHIIVTIYMTIKWKNLPEKKLSFVNSFLWILAAIIGSGTLLHVHSGTFTDVLFRTGMVDVPSFVSILVGSWYFYVMLEYVTKEKHVDPRIKIWIPVLFIFATALKGMIYNDEFHTNKHTEIYILAMIVLLLSMIVYAKIRKPVGKQTENDRRIPFLDYLNIKTNKTIKKTQENPALGMFDQQEERDML